MSVGAPIEKDGRVFALGPALPNNNTRAFPGRRKWTLPQTLDSTGKISKQQSPHKSACTFFVSSIDLTNDCDATMKASRALHIESHIEMIVYIVYVV